MTFGDRVGDRMNEAIETVEYDDPEWGSHLSGQKEKRRALLETLGELPIFDSLSWRELEKLERIVHLRHFVAGEMVSNAWSPRSGTFVVLSGAVNIVRVREDGSSIVVGGLGEREMVGEFAILDDSPRSTSIVSVEPSELIGFFRPDLMGLLQTDPVIGFKILYRLSQIMAQQFRKDLSQLRETRLALSAIEPKELEPEVP